jgi:hypothetical protein
MQSKQEWLTDRGRRVAFRASLCPQVELTLGLVAWPQFHSVLIREEVCIKKNYQVGKNNI